MKKMRGLQRVPLPFLFLLPTLVFLLVFFIAPLFQGVLLAFTTREGALTLGNFERAAATPYFFPALRNVLLLTAIIVPLQVLVALTIALLVNTRFFGSRKFLFLCAIPLGVSDLAAGLVFFSIFTQRGYLNTVLGGLGLIDVTGPPIYLSAENPQWLFTAVVFAELWRATAIVMIILVAGLQAISKDYLDAADVFGASRLQKLRRVTLPLLKPTLQSALIIRTIFAFQVFSVVFVLAGRILPVPAGEAFIWTYEILNRHVASVYGLILVIVSIAFTCIYLKLLKPHKEEVMR